MKETATDVMNRKIRNGLRKQAEAIQREKEKIWDKLKEEPLKTRKLHAGWTVEAEDDLKSMYGLDLEKEIADTLIAEINKEMLDGFK